VGESPSRADEAARVPASPERADLLNAPWSFSPMKGKPGHCFVAQVWDADGNSLAGIDADCGERAANARVALIAAAPDLYEAAASAVETIRAVANEIGDEFKHSARAHSLTVVARDLARALAKGRPADEGPTTPRPELSANEQHNKSET
jgi:hypothetical protein